MPAVKYRPLADIFESDDPKAKPPRLLRMGFAFLGSAVRKISPEERATAWTMIGLICFAAAERANRKAGPARAPLLDKEPNS